MGRIFDVCVKFVNTVSIRGVPKIFGTRNIFLKCMWILAVIASVCVLLWQVQTLFSKYASYPYKTIQKEARAFNSFPDITLCTLQPKMSGIDYDKCLTEVEYKIKIYNDVLPRLTEEMLRNLNSSFSIDDIEANKGYVSLTYFNSLSKYDSVLNSSMPLIHTRVLIDYLGAPITDKECDFENLTFWDANYHRCHTYRLKSSCKQNVKGVIMVLFINSISEIPQDDFDLNNTLTNGVSLALSVPGMVDDPFSRFILGTGTSNIINMVTTIRTRLDKPYVAEGCSNKTYLDSSGDNPYTRFTCSAACTQEALLKNCNCFTRLTYIPPYMQNFRLCANTSLTARNSSLSEMEEVKNVLEAMSDIVCESKIRNEELFRYCESQCQEPCNYTYYQSTVKTVGDWPYFTYHATFFMKYIKPYLRNGSKLSAYYEDYDVMISKYMNKNITLKELNDFFKFANGITSNFLELYIVFEGDKVQSFVDSPEYPWESMISLVGGSFSLWLGITVMTAVECVEFLIRILLAIKNNIISCKVESKL